MGLFGALKAGVRTTSMNNKFRFGLDKFFETIIAEHPDLATGGCPLEKSCSVINSAGPLSQNVINQQLELKTMLIQVKSESRGGIDPVQSYLRTSTRVEQSAAAEETINEILFTDLGKMSKEIYDPILHGIQLCERGKSLEVLLNDLYADKVGIGMLFAGDLGGSGFTQPPLPQAELAYFLGQNREWGEKIHNIISPHDAMSFAPSEELLMSAGAVQLVFKEIGGWMFGSPACDIAEQLINKGLESDHLVRWIDFAENKDLVIREIDRLRQPNNANEIQRLILLICQAFDIDPDIFYESNTKSPVTKPLRTDVERAEYEQKNNMSRNNPCLCGSGKRFKECCGKLI